MAADNITDLDILRPKPAYVRIGGVDIDVSFVPCGITFEVDQLVRAIGSLDQAAVAAGGEEAKKGFDLTVELCALYCSRKHPEMNVEWFLDNTDPQQVSVFASAIKAALFRSYEGVEEYQRPVPPKAKTTRKRA